MTEQIVNAFASLNKSTLNSSWHTAVRGTAAALERGLFPSKVLSVHYVSMLLCFYSFSFFLSDASQRAGILIIRI